MARGSRSANLRPRPLGDLARDGLPSGELVYRALKEAILSGELLANSRLVELSLARQFRVSRTPVREALKRLTAEQLAVLDPVRGMVVKAMDPQEIDEAYSLREVLDGLAARLSAQRISPEDLSRLRALMEMMTRAVEDHRRNALVELNMRFHELILGASGNERLRQLNRTLNDLVRLYSSTAFRSHERDLEVLKEHEAIMEALERRNPEEAERAARRHMEEARTFLARASVAPDLVRAQQPGTKS